MSSPQHEVPLPAWQEFVARNAAGGVLDGVVIKVMPFGAFVELTEGIHGLLHESEWANVPEVGSRLAVRIRAIDVERRRMSLVPA
jgi:small subunit ribosomal protein S1